MATYLDSLPTHGRYYVSGFSGATSGHVLTQRHETCGE